MYGGSVWECMGVHGSVSMEVYGSVRDHQNITSHQTPALYYNRHAFNGINGIDA